MLVLDSCGSWREEGYTGASPRTMLGAWARGKVGGEGKARREKYLAAFHAQHLALPRHPRTVVTWGSASSVTEARRPWRRPCSLSSAFPWLCPDSAQGSTKLAEYSGQPEPLTLMCWASASQPGCAFGVQVFFTFQVPQRVNSNGIECHRLRGRMRLSGLASCFNKTESWLNTLYLCHWVLSSVIFWMHQVLWKPRSCPKLPGSCTRSTYQAGSPGKDTCIS